MLCARGNRWRQAPPQAALSVTRAPVATLARYVFSHISLRAKTLALMATADEVLDEGAAPPGPVPPCGNPTCPFPNQAVRLQPIPEGFPSELVRPGATFFHRKKAACARHFGFQDPPQKPGRKRKDERLPIPVGKRLAGDECPPIIRRIDELWGHRCAACPARLCTPPHRCFCARRLADISEMRAEERSQPLTNGAIMESLTNTSKDRPKNLRPGQKVLTKNPFKP